MAPLIPKYVRVLILIINYILLRALVGSCVDCKNMYGGNNNTEYVRWEQQHRICKVGTTTQNMYGGNNNTEYVQWEQQHRICTVGTTTQNMYGGNNNTEFLLLFLSSTPNKIGT
jgi:hypothetical protein